MIKRILPPLFIILLAACQSAPPHPIQAGSTDTNTHTAARQYGSAQTAIAKPDATATAWLLVPGASAGAVRLGEHSSALYQQLGEADAGDAAMQKAVSIWYSHHDSTAHSVGVYTSLDAGNDTAALVRQIRVNSPSFHTREGIGPAASLRDIRRFYSLDKTDSYRDHGHSYTVYTSPAGISFEVNDAGRCVAVIIHKAGLKDIGTYLEFRTTNAYIDQR